MKYLVLIIGVFISYLLLRYRRAIRDFTGDFAFAEKYLGSGGTNTFIVLLGIAVFILSMMYFMGTLQTIIQNSIGVFFRPAGS